MAETVIQPDWLQARETAAVIAALGAEAARFVGGAVRDSLLARPVGDIDLATVLEPAEVMARLERAGLKAVPTGLDHGTVTAVAQGKPFQITTLRKDVETFGRHARVAFTEDWRADAARRDFTMNALYADADGRIYDYFGGVADARAGRVRFIGEPAQRIAEDALRILRFFRFHAHYGGDGLDPEGYAACREKRGLIDLLSIERLRDELLRLLEAPGPCGALAAMCEAGVLAHLLPETGELAHLRQLVALEQGLDRRDRLRRLAALAPRRKNVLDGLARRLRLSNDQRKRLAAMAGEAPDPQDPAALRAAAYRLGGQTAIDRLLLGATPASLETVREALALLESWTPPALPVSGRDLVRAGIPEGPELGRRLRALEERWIASDFTLSQDALLAALSSEDASDAG